MACRTPFLLFVSLSLLFLLATASSSTAVKNDSSTMEDDKNLSFLEEPKAASDDGDHNAAFDVGEDEGEDYENLNDFPDDKDWGSEFSPPSVDKKDVGVLNGSNFADFISMLCVQRRRRHNNPF